MVGRWVWVGEWEVRSCVLVRDLGDGERGRDEVREGGRAGEGGGRGMGREGEM